MRLSVCASVRLSVRLSIIFLNTVKAIDLILFPIYSIYCWEEFKIKSKIFRGSQGACQNNKCVGTVTAYPICDVTTRYWMLYMLYSSNEINIYDLTYYHGRWIVSWKLASAGIGKQLGETKPINICVATLWRNNNKNRKFCGPPLVPL